MKILKEPLFHFALIGLLLFVCFRAFDPEAGEEGDHEIRVPAARIEQLASIFRKTWQRPPTRNELEGLVDDFIVEEMYYREATAAGLDENDTLIRRRLRQKLEFLTEDLTGGQPDDEILRAFVEENPDRFRKPPGISFRQVFFNPERFGEDAEAQLAIASEALKEGKDPGGHPTLLPGEMSQATPQLVVGTFGSEFAKAIEDLPIGVWSEPLSSAFGIHFVKVRERIPGSVPPFEEIRKVALREWEHDRNLSFREQFDKSLREKYSVSIEWPETLNPEE